MATLSQAARITKDAVNAARSTVMGVADAVAGGTVGAATGAVRGASEGLDLPHASTPTIAVTLAALGAGAAGLIEWPVLALAGGTALVVKQLRGQPSPAKPVRRTEGTAATPTKKTAKKSAAPTRRMAAKKTSSASSPPGNDMRQLGE